MFVAYDKNDNRIYADDDVRYKECFCPICGEELTHRKGKIRRPHFAHQKKTDCIMDRDKDYNHEWHIRMQSYFPRENREYRFKDPDTGEVHIADVYDPDTETVIEFQHSRIEEEEYLSRTNYHINNGRRIIWIFDESSDNPKEGYRGHLKPDTLCAQREVYNGIPLYQIYQNRSFKWLYSPRSFLGSGPDLKYFGDKYRVFVFTGGDKDIVQRIISESNNFEYIVLSLGSVEMSKAVNMDEFFIEERSLLESSPWKELMEQYRENIRYKETEKKRQEELFKRARESVRLRNLKETSQIPTTNKYCSIDFDVSKEEDEEMSRRIQRVNSRKKEGLDTDLSKCPLCGEPIELKTIKKDSGAEYKIYVCINYPRCKFTESY